MSRRPKGDAPVEMQAGAAVVFGAPAAAGQPQCSNLLSNENVIAFAPGVVIDDGVASYHATTEEEHQKSTANPASASDRVKDAVNNCLRRQ